MTPTPAEAFIDQVFSLLSQHGHLHYGEDVNQLEHALQTAHHARLDGADDALVIAALLHDIGHLMQKLGEDAADRGLDDRHEDIGAGYLARAFGPEVTEPIRLHVAAKRYLAAREPGYFEQLSRASVQSLALQGGPMTEAEAEDFLKEPFVEPAIRLRRYDEAGKVVGAEPEGLEAFRASAVALAKAD
ncbi:phosphonate degradation HD-domain oxygenase [Phenylobacterium sp.]|uniref:phosphonate degradation HD-domain oxygenase n=1 Tax=Phenylobacterium sp. TaxID=1871053 RepID=UPI0035B24FAF